MALHALARNPEQEGQVKLFIPQTQHVQEGPRACFNPGPNPSPIPNPKHHRQLPKSISLAMMREHFGQFGEGVDECVLKQKQVPRRPMLVDAWHGIPSMGY